MKYHFKIHKEGNGFWAECIELEGCRTQGNSRSALLKNMAEVLNLYLSEPAESKMLFPHPRAKVKGRNIVAIAVEPSVAIANRIRETRLVHDLTQVEMTKRLGLRNLSNYQRLEDPRRANPQWDTLLLIKKAFPKFQVDDLL